jgi:hypothetical protein
MGCTQGFFLVMDAANSSQFPGDVQQLLFHGRPKQGRGDEGDSMNGLIANSYDIFHQSFNDGSACDWQQGLGGCQGMGPHSLAQPSHRDNYIHFLNISKSRMRPLTLG